MKQEVASLEDLQLVKAAQAGDRTAFDQLVVRYQDRVVGLAYSLMGCRREEALDAAQEAFLKAYRQLGKFRSEASFFTWLYRIVVNQCCDMRRRLARRARELSLEETREGEESHASLQVVDNGQTDLARRQVLQEELEQIVRSAVESLPDKQRTALLLREVENLSYQEIAKTMNMSTGTVMSRLHYARKMLAEKLASRLPELELIWGEAAHERKC